MILKQTINQIVAGRVYPERGKKIGLKQKINQIVAGGVIPERGKKII